MGLVRLVRLSASASSNVRNSYQIKHLTLVYTLSLPLTLLISFFPIQNQTILALNITDMAPVHLLFLRKIT